MALFMGRCDLITVYFINVVLVVVLYPANIPTPPSMFEKMAKVKESAQRNMLPAPFLQNIDDLMIGLLSD
jgi:hypothetical protein